jgi:hypothetical protein
MIVLPHQAALFLRYIQWLFLKTLYMGDVEGCSRQ